MDAVIEFLSNLNAFGVFGLIGFAAYLGAFGALQLGFLDGNGRGYAWLNIAGASFVLVSLYDAFNLASALIQISWIVIGYVGLIRRRSKVDQTFGRSLPV